MSPMVVREEFRHLGEDAWMWQRMMDERCPKAREHLIIKHADLVEYVAGQMAMGMPAEIQAADLETYGIFGLIEALDRFEPDRGLKFETYAVTRVRGAILDGVRKMDWIPVSIRRKAREIEQAYRRLYAQLGRSPYDEEMAQHLGISLERFRKDMMQVSGTALVYLDERVGGGDPLGQSLMKNLPAVEVEDPFKSAHWRAQKEQLAAAIHQLASNEQMVVTLYYYEGLTFTEIGTVLNLSPSRISQIHSKAVLKMRGKLTSDRHLFD